MEDVWIKQDWVTENDLSKRDKQEPAGPSDWASLCEDAF